MFQVRKVKVLEILRIIRSLNQTGIIVTVNPASIVRQAGVQHLPQIRHIVNLHVYRVAPIRNPHVRVAVIQNQVLHEVAQLLQVREVEVILAHPVHRHQAVAQLHRALAVAPLEAGVAQEVEDNLGNVSIALNRIVKNLKIDQMKKIIFVLSVCLLIAITAQSQNDLDAFRYSNTRVIGTARYMAMGGAFGSLGADFSTLSTNPAGLGLYKKSEVMFTPGFYTGQTESDYKGNQTYDSKNNFNLGNFGFVFANTSVKENSPLKNFQFAIGVNRINNFNNRMLMEGFNNESSIINTYVDRANGINYFDISDDGNGDYAFDLNPAWNTYMIDTIPGFSNQYYGPIPLGEGIYQRKEITSWGSMNEFVMSLGANLGDRVYVGGTFAFPYIRYYEDAYYTEKDQSNTLNDFDELQIYQSLNTHGSGFNMKFGMIVRATDYFRIGAAVHSPTWYNNMTDSWSSRFFTRFDNNDSYTQQTPVGNYDYKLETPWRAIGSASFVLWNKALISAEYEFIDYSQSKLRSRYYNFYDENKNIQQKYTQSHNLRMGGEFRMDQFAFRAGFGYSSSPFDSDINNGEKFYYSGGLGYREKNFFLDLAYVRSSSNEDYYFYGSENVSFNPVKNHLVANNILLTLGFRY